ncbi:MAG: laccase domain-containing protein [Candidatus Dojkabacteria bacterium]
MSTLTVKIDDKDLKFTTYSFGDILAGFSLGKNVNYHPLSDINLQLTSKVLNKLDLSGSFLKIKTEHKDKILINSDSEEADAIISTSGKPIILSPADCIGLILIDTKSNSYGLCHVGRAGVGYNIVEKFINKFLEIIDSTTYENNQFQFIISPNIDHENYPHNDDAFIYTDSKPNWWFNNQELLNKKDGTFFPNLEGAVIKQIKESKLKDDSYEIISSGLSTFKEDMHSNARDTHESIKEKRRNLVFVGHLDR